MVSACLTLSGLTATSLVVLIVYVYKFFIHDLEIDIEEEEYFKQEPIKFRVANYYGSYMVLQAIPFSSSIWGYGDPTLNVTMKLDNTAYTVMPDFSGKWKVYLQPMKPGGPYNIDISQGSEAIRLINVQFGDVWFCSGQSNMQFSMGGILNSAEEIQKSLPYTKIRYLQTARISSDKELEEPLGIGIKWTKPEPGTLSAFSALCFLHARFLFDELKIPIGLVESDWGGTKIESWSSDRVFKSCNETQFSKRKPSSSRKTKHMQIYDLETLWGENLGYSVLWNGMVHPYLEMAISGALWYQGEANTEYHGDLYNCTFPAMIEDWRNSWHRKTKGRMDVQFPFGFMQLAMNNNVTSFEFPNLRWHQTADTGNVPNDKMQNTFMAVGMDLLSNVPGNFIHPKDKLTMARRLSYASLNQVYMKTQFPKSGPYPTKVTRNVNSRELEIKYSTELQPARTDFGFQVCCGSTWECRDSRLKWINAPIVQVTNNNVAITWIGCDQPSMLSYAWWEQPCAYKKCALYSNDGFDLPALTWMLELTGEPTTTLPHYHNVYDDRFNPRRDVLYFYH